MTTNTDTHPVVEITLGKVRGQKRITVYDDQYYCFDGIPYAQPPIGALRFKSPQPAESWNGVRDCTEVAPKCMQYNRYSNTYEGSEDCLYLNVYAKKLKSNKTLPVMVYIHGGGFTTGSASRLFWGPEYFMMKDVVFITIGHRLGAFGFLSLPEPELEVPGNAGLKDIVLALKWIKQNCHNFNGNAENITLFGHSSGSCTTQLLMYAPQCEGLFHKVILMSGLKMHTQRKPNLEYRYAKYIGYTGAQNNADILNYLRSVEPEKLCVFSEIWTPEEKQMGYFYAFEPTTEHAESSDAIITQDLLDVFADKKAWSRKLSVMLGCTSEESLIRYKFYTGDAELYETYKVHPEYLLSLEVIHKCELEKQQELARKLIAQHFGERQLSVANAKCAIELNSYNFLYHPTQRYLRSRLANAQAPTYLYRFDFDSPTFNLYRIKHCGPQIRGVGHVDDLSYIFYMPESFKLERETAEFRTIERMIGLFTSFAATDDPNALPHPEQQTVTWSPLQAERLMCLNINHELSYIEWPEAAVCDIWDRLFTEAGLRLT